MQEHDEQQTDKYRPVTVTVEGRAEEPKSAAPPNVAASHEEATLPLAPSESFGSFNLCGSSLASDPYAGQPNPPAPEAYPAMSAPYAPLSPHEQGEPLPEYAPDELYEADSQAHAPLYFPVLRKAPAYIQFCGMFTYSLFMAICLMVVSLPLISTQKQSLSPFVNADSGGPNIPNFLLAAVLFFLILPACSLLSGALFGSWRGLLVSISSVGGGIFITHLSNNQFWNNPPVATYLPLLAFPTAALVVGLIYERRQSAAWWKSLCIMMLGAAIIAIWISALALVSSLNSPKFAAATASSNPSTVIVSMLIGGTIFSIIGTLALTFPISAIEGLLHWRIAAEKRS